MHKHSSGKQLTHNVCAFIHAYLLFSLSRNANSCICAMIRIHCRCFILLCICTLTHITPPIYQGSCRRKACAMWKRRGYFIFRFTSKRWVLHVVLPARHVPALLAHCLKKMTVYVESELTDKLVPLCNLPLVTDIQLLFFPLWKPTHSGFIRVF